jgi:transcriptional regulator with XRE-family HTH domain
MPQQRSRKVRKKTFDAFAAGAFLREERERQGLSQRAVAERAAVSQQTVVNIEHGTGSVTVKSLEAVALALDLDILTIVQRASG